MRKLLIFLALAGAAYCQQVNTDIIPASTGLNLGHSNQRWNGFFQNIDIAGTCTLDGHPCFGGSGGSGIIQFPGVPTGACTIPSAAVNITNGDFYSCGPGGWVQIGPLSVNAGTGLNLSTAPDSVTLNLNNILPNGEQAVTQVPGDTSAKVATDAFVHGVLSSTGLLPQSGCGVEAIAGTLQVTVGACYNYTINGVQYSSPLTTLTLATADPTNPRLDLIGANCGGNPCTPPTGAAFATTGTPAVNPVAPAPDPSTQFALTNVLVPANATSLSLTVVDIYHDCTQWTLSSSGAPINTCSAANPYNGANPKSVVGTSATTGNYAQFTDPASGTVTLPQYNNLVFYVSPSAVWPATRSITLQWYNGSTAVGSPVLVANGTFGFNTSLASYQQVAVPTALFNTSTPVGTLRMTVSGTGAVINFYIADITLQGGASNGSGAIYMNNSGIWNSTASYNAQNFVTSSGNPYVAVAANSNSTPSTTNANWFPLINVGSNQQVIYNCVGGGAGPLCGDAGMLYNSATHAFTVTGSLNITGGTTGTITALEGTAASGVVGSDVLWADSGSHCWKISNNNGSGNCIATSATGGAVSSVTGDGTIITNSASTGAVTLSIAGTSGGIPYFSSSSAWASSAALTAHGVVVGGGAGTAPTSTAAGTAHQTLVSAGASANPVYQDQRDVHIIPVCANVGGTAAGGVTYSTGWTPTNRAGTNNLGCALQAIPSTGGTLYTNSFLFLPSDWDTASQPFITILYGSGANTSGTVIWTVSSACTKQDGSVSDDPTFNAESAFGSQTMAVANRAWAKNGQFTAVTSGNNCIAGSPIIFKIVLSGTAASNINLYQISIVFPTLPQVQAN